MANLMIWQIKKKVEGTVYCHQV